MTRLTMMKIRAKRDWMMMLTSHSLTHEIFFRGILTITHCLPYSLFRPTIRYTLVLSPLLLLLYISERKNERQELYGGIQDEED